jgi:F420H(2)-dependent quinone reductase
MAVSGDPETSRHADLSQDQIDQILESGTTEGVEVKGTPVVLITYRGRRTGERRHLPCMRVEHEGSYACVASKGGAPENPAWYPSVRDAARVDLQDGTVTRAYAPRELAGEERSVWWERAVAAYPDYAEYQRRTDRELPVLVLEPRD